MHAASFMKTELRNYGLQKLAPSTIKTMKDCGHHITKITARGSSVICETQCTTEKSCEKKGATSINFLIENDGLRLLFAHFHHCRHCKNQTTTLDDQKYTCTDTEELDVAILQAKEVLETARSDREECEREGLVTDTPHELVAAKKTVYELEKLRETLEIKFTKA